MAILPIPPAFPVPVLPQVFDTSLSYYELLAKLTETINAVSAQVNQNTANIAANSASISTLAAAVESMQQQLDGIPSQVADLTAALAQEVSDREAGDNLIQDQLAELKNTVYSLYVSYEDMATDYLLGDVTFHLLTQEAFDALEAAGQLVEKRVYLIDTGSNIVIKLGTSSGGTLTFLTPNAGNFEPRIEGQLATISGTFVPDEEG
jgi:hypothetical protein